MLNGMNKKEKDQHNIYFYHIYVQIQYNTNYLDRKPCVSCLHICQEFKRGMDDPGQIHVPSEEWLKSYTSPVKFLHLPHGCSSVFRFIFSSLPLHFVIRVVTGTYHFSNSPPNGHCHSFPWHHWPPRCSWLPDLYLCSAFTSKSDNFWILPTWIINKYLKISNSISTQIMSQKL